MQKIKLAIVYGGPGGEHEVSAKSAKNILENIDKSKYEVKEIFLPKSTKTISKKIIVELHHYLVWPIFHGEFGEGGYVQEVLEKNKMKFVGPNSKISRLAIDKLKTQKLLEKNKILCPKTFVISNLKNLQNKEILKLAYPIILKPINGGSTIDVFKVQSLEESENSAKFLLKKYKNFLLQEFVEGREFTCGAINVGKKIIVLPLSEVVLNGQNLFDYNAKYNVAGLEKTPAKVDEKIKKKLQAIGKRVYELVGAKDFARTDIILDKKGKIFVLEINTIPGLSPVSFIPEQLKVQGIKMSEFIDLMVKNHL